MPHYCWYWSIRSSAVRTHLAGEREVGTAVVHLTEIGVRIAKGTYLRGYCIALHKDIAAQFLEEIYLQIQFFE